MVVHRYTSNNYQPKLDQPIVKEAFIKISGFVISQITNKNFDIDSAYR